MSATSDRSGLIGLLRTYPIITGVIVGCTLVGIVLGLYFLPVEWTLARRIAGGALGGAGCALIVTAPRIIG
jgi:hypothetical protein